MSLITPIARPFPRLIKAPVKRALRFVRSFPRRDHPRVFLNSIPKSGTHLIEGLLARLGYRLCSRAEFNSHMMADYDVKEFETFANDVLPSECFVEHLPWNAEAGDVLERLNIKTLFIYRDPRSMALSNAHWVMKRRWHRLRRQYKSLPSIDERVRAEVEGTPDDRSSNGIGRSPLADVYDRFAGWKDDPRICVIRFEDIVGARGGGDDGMQAMALRRALDFLGDAREEEEFEKLLQAVFNEGSDTFRKGRVDSWREELNEETAGWVTERLAAQLSAWGYEE